MINLAIIYYSSTGTTYGLARAMERSAQEAGAEVRLRKVREIAPREAIEANEAWAAHLRETEAVPEAATDDLEWADALLLGSPTRYGSPTSQFQQFLDTTGPLWAEGKLADKLASSFTSTSTRHGGQESTLLALNNTFYHWGCILVPPGYLDSVQFKAGNPYGTSFTSNNGELERDEIALAAARFQAERLVRVAERFVR